VIYLNKDIFKIRITRRLASSKFIDNDQGILFGRLGQQALCIDQKGVEEAVSNISTINIKTPLSWLSPPQRMDSKMGNLAST
jgi:hypothetical protein